MKVSEGFPKGLPLVFVATVAVYLLVFHGIERARDRKGPWNVHFETAGGAPSLVISQSGLGVENMRVVFPEESAPEGFVATNIVFATPRQAPFATPFGECFFQDLTFLPGTVTLRPFEGHEVELLPRTLYVNRREHPWKPGGVIEVRQADRVPHLIGGGD